ncbi:hypothetical protein O3G_MSEX015145 [Manduca sexta]|uniref:FAD-binding PCMH-type domain-containing protein n=1 Tax=Manduca sexta TaxID=7130 RepID=A0A922D198_MANSE|nr:hypothetical protein O3G_MSEX015145 [Manduca sexta]
MVSITSCQGWDITTIEEIGNRKKGYHILQKTLASYNGTQCGYCSPAWVMAMYSLLQTKKDLTMLEIEQSFGSNVCRCTGIRPILEAFKKFGKDAPKNERIMDIEDLHICKKTGKNCLKVSCEKDEWCMVSDDDVKVPNILELKLKDNKYWYRVTDVADIHKILNEKGYDSYMLVCGNTAKGAYPIFEYPRILIDISTVEDLKTCMIDQNLILGAGLTLTELLDTFKTASKEEYFRYLEPLHEHLHLVAHIPVRNLGSIGGNLMIKHRHNEFSSDIFLMLETVGATLDIDEPRGYKKELGYSFRKTLTMQQFLQENMKGKVILRAMLPPLSNDHHVITYKVMPRSQNAHAIVNAGFLYQLSIDGTVKSCRIVYGGLSPHFNRASATETHLIGKKLFTNETLQSALNILASEIIVVKNPPEPSVEYRKQLALGLFYKIQCSGEAKFVEDMPTLPDEVFAAFVLSTVPLGDIVSIDASAALKMPGVIAFYSANDIPGENSFTPAGTTFYVANEEIFCSGQIKYYNQPIGMIVAETRPIAERAAKVVIATYKNVRKPLLSIKDAKKDPNRNTLFTSTTAESRGTDVVKTFQGSNTIFGQYHYTMETLCCVSKTSEEGLEVHSACQWIDGTQVMTSKALNIDCHKIDVHLRRVGGAFGIKISRSIQVAVACSLVVQKLNRPCRFIQSLTTNTKALGKRLSCSTDYEIGVNNSGVIQYINYKLYEDNGYKVNETLTMLGTDVFYNCYNNSRWNYTCYDSITDKAKNTWCRSPGTLENIAMAEYLMERISYEMSLDPIDVRLANLNTTRFNDLTEMSNTLKTTAKYAERRAAITSYNAQNRWKKRGLRVAFLRWTPVGAQYLNANISVFHEDGTVAIVHAGVDMGQGVNTKAVQVCAYFLKIPISKIQIKAKNTTSTPNGFISGGSLTSQNIIIAVRRACEELLRRLAPIRARMVNPTWEELIKEAFNSNVDLQVHGFAGADDVQNFNIYGVAIAESEIDVLTGEMQIRRVDILQDVGQSVSPEIDVGQVEGAFIMGLGYWTCEELVYDKKTGEVLTDRTWNYPIPLALDIPQDFRVYFRKKSYSTELILGAKGTGEPPMCLAIVVAFAIREAIVAARQESGIPSTQWFEIDGPYTVEKICLASSNCIKDFKLY